MKVVIDANTLAAGAIRREPLSIVNQIVDAWSENNPIPVSGDGALELALLMLGFREIGRK